MGDFGPAPSSSSSCGADVWVNLLPLFQANFTLGTTMGFRLRVTAQDSCGIDKEIFRYYQKPLNLAGVLESVFSGVCSWPDLTELPITEPEFDTSPSGFRLDYFDIVVSSESIANAVWSLIKTQVDELVQTVKDGENLEAQTEYIALSV